MKIPSLASFWRDWRTAKALVDELKSEAVSKEM